MNDQGPQSPQDPPSGDPPAEEPPAGGDPTSEEPDGADDRAEPGRQMAPQRLRHPDAAPPDPPHRTGIFVDVPSLRTHVGDLLRAFLGGYQVDAFGNMTFTHEDARVFVTVGMSPIGPQVGVFSITNVDVELTPQLAEFLLTTNHSLGFGAFSYDGDNRAVWLRHSLLGATIDAPELQSAVAAVASTAAHFDEIIQGEYGGRAFRDEPTDVQDATAPPPPNAGGYL